jgi:2,4-dienoyl-CoA reductase-like NADH-dependent reductase (Old Yellow Enzyme family)
MINPLFLPLKLKSITLNNRLVVSPMCQYSSVDGFATDWHLVHLGSRAVGGAALIFTEATAVAPEGRISPSDLGIWKDEHIVNLKRITDFIQKQGAVPGIQLAHAGRKASQSAPWLGGHTLPTDGGGWIPFAPSPIAFKSADNTPEVLSLEGIKKVIEDFKKAAKRALDAGFKVLEIHAAHGYLINSFLSPLTNTRTDNYGGSFENRCRLLLEILDSIKKVWPENLPLFVRLSATEWKEGGWDENNTVALSKLLKNAGVDLIDCSSGGNIADAKIPVGPLYQLPFAEKVKKEAEIFTGAVGMITTPDQANQILEEGKADLIFMAREFLRDPYFPMHAATTLSADLKWPVQYERAKPHRP